MTDMLLITGSPRRDLHPVLLDHELRRRRASTTQMRVSGYGLISHGHLNSGLALTSWKRLAIMQAHVSNGNVNVLRIMTKLLANVTF